MTKIDIISGFLGAGKTTFIKKLLQEAIAGEQVVLIENEFGEIGIDGGFLKDAGVEIREMNSGCICCSLVGDFGKSLEEVLTKYHPDRVIIEPSGVGKLSDVMKAVIDVASEVEVTLNSAVTIVDAQKCRMYRKNFGEFFNNQIENAGTIVLSRTDIAPADKVDQALQIIRELNPKASVVTTPCDELSGKQLLEIIEKPDTMAEDLMKELKEHRHHQDEAAAAEAIIMTTTMCMVRNAAAEATIMTMRSQNAAAEATIMTTRNQNAAAEATIMTTTSMVRIAAAAMIMTIMQMKYSAAGALRMWRL